MPVSIEDSGGTRGRRVAKPVRRTVAKPSYSRIGSGAQRPSNPARNVGRAVTSWTPARNIGRAVTSWTPARNIGRAATYSPPPSSYSRSYSGGAPTSYSGGGSTPAPAPATFAAVTEPPAPPPPPPPVMETITIPDPLSDPNYQRTKAQLQRNLAGFNARDQLARQQYQGTVDDTMRQMGWRGGEEGSFDPNARGTAYGSSYENNLGDFSGRGLFYSGELAKAISDMNNDFSDRRSGVLRNQRDWTATQDLSRRNFLDDQSAADEDAIADAIAAIAARYAVNTNQVIRGRENQITRERVSP